MQVTGARLNSGGYPTLGSLSHGSQKPRQISRHSEPLCPRWESARKQSQKEKKTRGNQSFQELARETGPSFIFQEKLLYLSCTQISMDNAKSCRVSSPDPYQDQAFPLHTQLYTQVLGDLHHFLAQRPISIYGPFLIRVHQPENLFALKVLFLLKSGATLRKH